MPKRILDLKDFNNDSPHEEDADALDEVTARLQEIARLKAAHASALEETKRAAFEAGRAEGRKEAGAEFESILEARLEEQRQNCIAANAVTEAIHKRSETVLQTIRVKVNDIVVDSLGEILEYLYLNTAQAEFIASMIEKIIDEFTPDPAVTVHVHPDQFETMHAIMGELNVVADEEILPGDFRIDFTDYLLEHELADKIEVIKNEIKKEIEKSSEIQD